MPAALLALASCNKERRVLEADQPVTAPAGPQDPRTRQFQANAWQVSQGGRYFSWYGCAQCHGGDAKGALDLGDGEWRRGSSVDRVYASIAAHRPIGDHILPEQRWQLAAYVQQLPSLDPAKRRRQDLDQVGEPQADRWSGPIQ